MSDLTICNPPYSGWIMLTALAIVGAWLCLTGVRRRRSTPTPGRCWRCGYDTHFSTGGICSECGASPDEMTEVGRRRVHWFVLGLIVMCGLPAYVAQGRIREWGWRYYTAVGPLYWLLPKINCGRFVDGTCVASLTLDRREACFGGNVTRLTVMNGSEVIYDQYLGTYGLGWPRDESDPRSVAVPVQCDLDGDGAPECVLKINQVDQVDRLLIVSGGQNPHVWVDVTDKPGNSTNSPAGITINHFFRSADGELLIAAGDPASFTWKQAHTMPPIVLRAKAGKLEIALDRMRDPLPGDDDLAQAVAKARAAMQEKLDDQTNFDAHWQPLLEPMFRLIYTGHADAAEAFLDRAWVGSAEEKVDLLNDLHRHLKRSLYWQAIVELNKSTVPESTLCESD